MVNGKNSKKAGMNLVNHIGSSSDAKASPTEKITGLNEVFQKQTTIGRHLHFTKCSKDAYDKCKP
jgi:hypothetical protein